MISAGRVTVNGRTADLGVKADPDKDDIRLDGQPIAPFLNHVYLAMNKPAGYLSTCQDPQGRPTVMDLVPDKSLYPVGRLDMDTTGLLFMTNDGDFAYLIMHPSHGVDKTYLARVLGVPRPAALQHLRNGVELDDGLTAPAGVRLIQSMAEESLLEIVIHEGRKRQVRRMLAAVGHPVKELCRTAIDGIRLEGIKPGTYRALAPEEVIKLRQVASGDESSH